MNNGNTNSGRTIIKLNGKRGFVNGSSKVTANISIKPKFGFLSGFVMGLLLATIIQVLF